MLQQKVTVSFFLDKSRPNAEKKCLIKINVYCKPNKKRYATIYHVTENEWTKLNAPNLRDESLKEIKQKLNALQASAEEEIDEIVPFSFVAFEDVFFDKSTVIHDSSLKTWIDKYITQLKTNGQIGTAIAYNTTKNSLHEFRKSLLLQDITPAFLEEYEKYMLQAGKSATTISMYLRQLRAIINQAIDAGTLSLDKYPFRKYEIPSGRNIKKALSEADIQKLLNYVPTKVDEQKALDFWLFSYLCSGVNFADIIQLKPENIKGDFLWFYREKTKRTKKKDLRPITIGLVEEAKSIIDKWKNTNPLNPYLFPVLEAGLPALTVKHRCQRFIKWVNKRMEITRQELKIESKLGTYTARHTFATVLKRKGASTAIIKESLGHSSEVTTENYLDSFTDDVKLKYANMLTAF